MSKHLGNLMKQAQMLQNKMVKFQEELELKEYEGFAGGGMVKVVVNGKLMLLSITIDKQAVNPDDAEMLQDMIFAAVKSAQEKAADTIKDEMSKITGGMGVNIPGLF
jgi:DNA-binding YbaB/EbfC family protein